MFTGIVTDIGEVLERQARGRTICTASRSPAAMTRAGDRRRRVDRLLRRLPHGGGHRRRGRADVVRGRCGSRDAAPDHGGPLAARHTAQSRARAQSRRRARRPSGLRPCRRDREVDRARGSDRHGASRHFGRRRRSRASSRKRARLRSTACRSPSTRSRAIRFSVLIIPHTLAVTTLGALRRRRPGQPRDRPDGALRGAADGAALSLTPAFRGGPAAMTGSALLS